jgi:hypothetical protein
MTTLLEELGVDDIRDVQRRYTTVQPANVALEFIPSRDDGVYEKIGTPILRPNRSGYNVSAGDAIVMPREVVQRVLASPAGFTVLAVCDVDDIASDVFQGVFECASIATGDDSIYAFITRSLSTNELCQGSVGLAYNPNDYQGRQDDSSVPTGVHVIGMRYDPTLPVVERLSSGFDGYIANRVDHAGTYDPTEPFSPEVEAGTIGFYADSRFTLGSTVRDPNPPGVCVPRVGYLVMWEIPLVTADWISAMHETLIRHSIS